MAGSCRRKTRSGFHERTGWGGRRAGGGAFALAVDDHQQSLGFRLARIADGVVHVG